MISHEELSKLIAQRVDWKDESMPRAFNTFMILFQDSAWTKGFNTES